MPLVRSLASKRLAYYFKLVAVILLLSKIMLTYSRCAEKGLVYIIIMALSSCQSFSYTKFTRLNMHFSYNIYLVSNAKCIFLTRLYIR